MQAPNRIRPEKSASWIASCLLRGHVIAALPHGLRLEDDTLVPFTKFDIARVVADSDAGLERMLHATGGHC